MRKKSKGVGSLKTAFLWKGPYKKSKNTKNYVRNNNIEIWKIIMIDTQRHTNLGITCYFGFLGQFWPIIVWWGLSLKTFEKSLIPNDPLFFFPHILAYSFLLPYPQMHKVDTRAWQFKAALGCKNEDSLERIVLKIQNDRIGNINIETWKIIMIWHTSGTEFTNNTYFGPNMLNFDPFPLRKTLSG